MLSALTSLPPDPILMLIDAFRNDPRPEKLDFGVGVYKDAEGRTPILASVKAAEARVFDAQDSKTYLGLHGDVSFSDAMVDLVLGEAAPTGRVSATQTAGGAGALFNLLSLAKAGAPNLTLWMPTPTWFNHETLADFAGVPVKRYRYFEPTTRSVDAAGMREDLSAAGPNDVVLLHGCCHNPTGADVSLDDWRALAEMSVTQGFVPLIDLAYQGLGDGLVEDVAGLRHMARCVPEMMIAASCSKSFGLYRDRVGCAIAISARSSDAPAALSTMAGVTRAVVSMPPDHGAAVVRTILTDAALREMWEGELHGMRERIGSLRRSLAAALRARANSDRFDFFAAHKGMFSRTGASPAQVDVLREEHAIYIVGDGRMNLAGLTEARVGDVADAFLAVGL